MTATEQQSWTRANQRSLTAELDRLHGRITGSETVDVDPGGDSGLTHLRERFRLTGFEWDLLLWCAGAELDDRFTPPTFAAALATLPGGHWDAIVPAAALRRWGLIELSAGASLLDRPLRIGERILHHLVGVSCVDTRLDGIVRAESGRPGALTEAQATLATELAALLGGRAGRVTVVLDGAGADSRARVVARVADELGLLLLVLPADRIPPPGPDNAALARLVEREVALLGALPLVAVEETGAGVTAFIAELGCAVVIGAPSVAVAPPADIRRTVPAATVTDQRELWLARAGLAELAEHIEPHASWDDLVLPDQVMRTLRDIAGQVRHRTRVYEEWGMAGTSPRGRGITALFTGESGTGKTLAAEVLAAELDLDLYRIDLAAVVSKYIGETEKNLRRVFDAADASGAVLLFDEADALFGKRSEVRDSHDRYANLEISYLLQRMETYRGPAILTTNLKSALDRAFLRRIRFVVGFPFPDPPARARIWRLMFPPTVPVSNLDWSRLSRLQLSGGHIRTIALGAAFLAAAADEPVTMHHLRTAARREYAKLDKPLTETEIGDWT